MLKPTKAGDRPLDFRRLSFSSTVKRIGEKLCAKVMLTEYSIAEVQGGFRKHRSCSGRLLVVLGIRAQALVRNWAECLVCLIDFRSCFDTVCTDRVQAFETPRKDDPGSATG